MSMTERREPREHLGPPREPQPQPCHTNHTMAINPYPLTSAPPYGRPSASPPAGVASRDGVGLLTPALLLRQERGRRARADRGFWSGRVAAAPELAATRRPLREAKRQQLIEECDVRPRDCVPMHGRVRAWSRSTAQQTATTAVGLELGSDDGLVGTIGFDGRQSRDAGRADDRIDQPRARFPRDRLATKALVPSRPPRRSPSRESARRSTPPRRSGWLPAPRDRFRVTD